jgi:hypothetical protein
LERRGRRDVEDPSLLPFEHARQVRAAQLREGADLERDEHVELRRIGVGERCEVAEAGVVHEHVDVGDLCDHTRHTRAISSPMPPDAPVTTAVLTG